MSISAEARRAQLEAIRQVEGEPVILSRYAFTQGDGLVTPDAWSWFDSFRATVDDLPRSSWFPQTTDARLTKHLYIALTPSNFLHGPDLSVDQRVKFINAQDGLDQGTFRIVYVNPLRIQGHTYAFELILEQFQ